MTSEFPPVSSLPNMFFGASCYECKHTGFVTFQDLDDMGFGALPYDRAMKALKCSQCGSKKLSVTVHGSGVQAA